uniref:Uncharacterized protein n=1 Tax=Arundo donax TaxID=35708 RepID=A0A0A9GN27_ARUDO
MDIISRLLYLHAMVMEVMGYLPRIDVQLLVM